MMSDNKNEYIALDKEMLEKCLRDLGNALKRRIKQDNVQCELIVVGGASVILNYGFRYSTLDVDCTDEHKILMNDVINSVAEKNHLPFSWINTSFMNTKSYSPKISQYSSFYKSYGNGTLLVRTIKDEYLLAMKVVSGRKYKNDYSDIYGIITTTKKNDNNITIEKVYKAIIDLYDSFDNVDKDAYEFVKKIISNPESITYEEIRKMEKDNEKIVRTKVSKDLEQSDIDYILSKLEI